MYTAQLRIKFAHACGSAQTWDTRNALETFIITVLPQTDQLINWRATLQAASIRQQWYINAGDAVAQLN